MLYEVITSSGEKAAERSQASSFNRDKAVESNLSASEPSQVQAGTQQSFDYISESNINPRYTFDNFIRNNFV